MGLRMKRTAGMLLIALATGALPARAQWTATVTVRETAGIRRTNFPARLSMEVPEGRLRYVNQLRLVDANREVTTQGTAWSTWSDGSIRELDVDFNISMGPFEERALELAYGSDVSGTSSSPRGLVPSEGDGGITVGRVRLNRVGSPLLASVAYRSELIGQGRNGIVVVERSGIRRDAREIRWEPFQVLKNGPLTVLVRYRGHLTLSGGSRTDITLDAEMPNSKSWVKISASVSDPEAKVGEISVETPLRLGAHPWTWDFATPNGSYGAFRDPTGSAIFTRTFDESGAGTWRILSGSAASEQPYESSASTPVAGSATWAHFIGAEEAVAFAVETAPGVAGSITIWLAGTGETAISFRSAELATEHALTVYEHFVATPLPIGAATSTASILKPLRVTVE